MNKFILGIGLILLCLNTIGQDAQQNVIYIIDSITVMNDPEPGNEVLEENIADVTVMKNKDSLKLLGLDQFDGAIFIFTKEYRKRSEELKQVPSSLQMEKKNGVWYFRGSIYTGKFIDYYYSGRKQGEGTFQNGLAEGHRVMYHQNGKLVMERYYVKGIENGLEKEYYEDGTLRQKGEFVNGKEDGVWEMYFPNGQVKQKSTFKNGSMEGETTVYNSSGKVLAIEVTKNGKTIADKRNEKVNQAMSKGHSSSKEGNYKEAAKFYSKAIDLDTTNSEAYFARGTVKLNEFQFEEAIADFDRALKFEPYAERSLTNRAFARIRKHQYGSGRKLSEINGITVMASPDKPEIPASELASICNDLKQAIFLGDRGKMILDATKEFCETKK